MIDDSISALATWLSEVDLGNARERIDADLARHFEKEGAPRTLEPASTAILVRSSLHEAAHVVAAHSLGLKVMQVVLRADASGAAEYHCNDDDVAEVLARVIADMAGAALEALAGDLEARAPRLAGSFDILKARFGVERCVALAPELGITHAAIAALACATVATHLEAIGRVAAALRHVGALDKATITALCGRAN
jgi:hypothetical protein